MPKKSDRRTTPRGFERITIECVAPELDAGRHPVKRIVGDIVWIGADIFKEGQDKVAGRVLYREPGEAAWRVTPLIYDYDSDRWYASITLHRIGGWTFTIEAWTDLFTTWREALNKKIIAGQDVQVELLEGAALVRAAAAGVKGPARLGLTEAADILEGRVTLAEEKVKRALEPQLAELVGEYFKPTDLTRFRHELQIVVDPEKARFSAWYEFFVRSSASEDRHGTFADAMKLLPRIAKLGFDVAYLPPIHPIGHAYRKGRNNSLTPEPGDVGSPWAIGNEQGGHTAIEPALGTLDAFARFVKSANEFGIEVALDYAPQCSPDHPWVKEHPDWFHIRPDGSIAYAENPPKKYQDIYPLNFWCADRVHLWDACRDIVLFWVKRGVKIFRVDNPHTKSFAFWEWMIADVQQKHPDVIFFAEAFTRPKRMKHLAKLGFAMSYTYFTWKNSSRDLKVYLTELTQGAPVEYYRPNFFANTPDILNEYLVEGGRPAFRIRLLLAATLSSLYGIYSGFELCENTPVKPGSEEYLDSEKYQIRPRDWNAEGNINAEIELANRIRREQKALQRIDNLTFHKSENPTILFYRKAGTVPARQWVGTQWVEVPEELAGESVPGDGDLLIAVTTDFESAQESWVHVPVEEMGIGDDESYVVHDLLTGAKYTWSGSRNYVRLDPNGPVGHVFAIEKSPTTGRTTEQANRT